jgi:hypothetical protein
MDELGGFLEFGDYEPKNSKMEETGKKYIQNEELMNMTNRIKFFVDSLIGSHGIKGTTPRVAFEGFEGKKDGFVILCDNGHGNEMLRYKVTIEDYKHNK